MSRSSKKKRKRRRNQAADQNLITLSKASPVVLAFYDVDAKDRKPLYTCINNVISIEYTTTTISPFAYGGRTHVGECEIKTSNPYMTITCNNVMCISFVSFIYNDSYGIQDSRVITFKNPTNVVSWYRNPKTFRPCVDKENPHKVTEIKIMPDSINYTNSYVFQYEDSTPATYKRCRLALNIVISGNFDFNPQYIVFRDRPDMYIEYVRDGKFKNALVSNVSYVAFGCNPMLSIKSLTKLHSYDTKIKGDNDTSHYELFHLAKPITLKD